MNETEIAQKIAEIWFNAPISGDAEKAFSCLADDVEWIDIPPVKGLSDVLPWIGTKRGADNVVKSLLVYMGVADVTGYELRSLIVQGNQAVGITHETGTVKATGLSYEVDFSQLLQIDTSKGKIVRRKAFWDPTPVIAAFRGGPEGK